MEQPDRFTPSAATLAGGTAPADGGRVWRDGRHVVLAPGAAMPPRCVKCNAPAVLPSRQRTVYWHHWGFYFIILLNILIYAVVALIVRKRARIDPGLCARHKRRRAIWIGVGWAGVVAAIAAIAWSSDPPAGVAVGVLILLVALVAAIIGARIVVPREISTERIRLAGCGRSFLESLPQWPGG
jgi:hypothetical protein